MTRKVTITLPLGSSRSSGAVDTRPRSVTWLSSLVPARGDVLSWVMADHLLGPTLTAAGDPQSLRP